MYNLMKKLMLFALIAICASSCVTKKKLTYLREVTAESADSVNAHFEAKAEVTIKKGDQLTIFISALDQEAVAPYNLYMVNVNDPSSLQLRTTPTLLTYRVDEQGDIEMPVLGKVHVEGMVRTELEELVKKVLLILL